MRPTRVWRIRRPPRRGSSQIWLYAGVTALVWLLACRERPVEVSREGTPVPIVGAPTAGHTGSAVASSRPGAKTTPATHWTECSGLDTACTPQPELVTCSSSAREG